MRLAITLLVACLAVSCLARPQDQEYDYEDEPLPAAPVTPAPTKASPRGLPNARQGRGPSPLLHSRNTKTTAAPVKPQEPEVVNEPADFANDGEEYLDDVVTPSTTTTVAPKKGIAPIVRPFRSNQDLLAALKRRRQQEQQGGTVATHATTTTTTTAQPAEHSNSNKRTNSNSNSNKRTYNSRNKAPAPVQEAAQETEVTKRPAISAGFNRRFTSRGRATSAAPPASVEDVEEEEVEEPAPRAAKSYRGGRRS